MPARDGAFCPCHLPYMESFLRSFRPKVTKSFTAFKDSTLREKALNRLNSLRQGNRSFSELLSELDRQLLEAGGHEYEDRIKKGYVKAALNYALRERLVTVSEEPSYDGYCRQVKEIADRMAELQQLQRS